MADLNSTRSISEKITGCMNCGAAVTYKTNSNVYCAPCRKAVTLERSRKNAARKRIKSGIEPVKGTTIACTDCRKFFQRRVVRQVRCPECQKAYSIKKSRWYSSTRASDDARRERFNLWWREKCRLDPKWKLNCRFGSLMSKKLSRHSVGKSGRSWTGLVEYTLEDLVIHLERQFLPGMSWENYGRWHIDHIIPCSSFEFESPDDPEFKSCWALSNLRPLWAKDNIRKQAQIQSLI